MLTLLSKQAYYII